MTSVPLPALEHALLACKRSFASVAGFSLFVNFLMLAPSFYMLQVYDRVLASGNYATLLMLTLILVVLLATMGALEWVRARILVRVSTRLDTLLGPQLFNAGFDQALYSSGHHASGQPLQDLAGLRQFLTGNGLFAFFDAPWIPLYIGVMFLFHPWFGWFGVACAVVLVMLAWLNEQLTREPLKHASQDNLHASTFVGKSLRNAEVVCAMGMLERLRQRWLSRNHQVLLAQQVASDRAGAIAGVSKTVRMLVQSLILALGAWLVLRQEISPGLMIAGSILLGRALAPIDLMIGAWRGFSGARLQYARLSEVLEHNPPQPARMPLPAPSGQISLEGLTLVPPGATQAVLRDLSVQVPAGTVVGVIGASGAGKSSLARALLGIWPATCGTVRLDGAEIGSWARAELGQHVGYLPQDIELFDGSISENIARFAEVDPQAVIAAAQMAGVHELILRLPDGYDTQLGASGGVLSGGQRQRVGLARALYGRPRLVVLDEPNANLDEEGEQALLQALDALKAGGSSVFVITHRNGVLAHVDSLLLLRDGTLALYGARDAVLRALQGPRPLEVAQ
ncbi:type I secretion system permease/ATPase [Pseudomonas aegrilactucae]|uniref:Type I secretion system permease/ATPase n=1 Tax=Pseudomonas aegrilactucae TaxID=2854028 RepID=A0A9Q3ADM4_9PSED|nr:type I secretion system permease/ATPase [Pseudomonas aegrilactucae]MBV6287614.1 type I secretion system permease/ATPase [Pseudomonas aegrilactucae]